MSTLLPRGIYAITDGQPHRLIERSEQALAGGVAMIQYRDLSDDHLRRRAEAATLAMLCARYNRPLIIDHDIALAQAVGAAGVHLSQADGDPAAVRAVLGSQAIVGVSCYASVELALGAARAGWNWSGVTLRQRCRLCGNCSREYPTMFRRRYRPARCGVPATPSSPLRP